MSGDQTMTVWRFIHRFCCTNNFWVACVLLAALATITIIETGNSTIVRTIRSLDAPTTSTQLPSSSPSRHIDGPAARSNASVRTTMTHIETLPAKTVVEKMVQVDKAAERPIRLDERTFYSRRPHRVNNYTYKAILRPTSLCSNDTKILILIHSHPSYAERRQAIRQTWGGAVRTGRWPGATDSVRCCQRMRLAFVVALSTPEVNAAVRDEHAANDDIVQGDFVDAYRNLTLKSLLDLRVAAEFCRGVPYLLKSDDDMIVNLPFLVDRLASLGPVSRTVVGPFLEHRKTMRSGKWALSDEEFPFEFLPPYAAGSAYVLTGDLVDVLLDASDYVPYIFIDDVYITGILGRIVGIRFPSGHRARRGRPSHEFAYYQFPPPTACDLVKGRVLTGSRMSPERLVEVWRQLVQLMQTDGAGGCMRKHAKGRRRANATWTRG